MPVTPIQRQQSPSNTYSLHSNAKVQPPKPQYSNLAAAITQANKLNSSHVRQRSGQSTIGGQIASSGNSRARALSSSTPSDTSQHDFRGPKTFPPLIPYQSMAPHTLKSPIERMREYRNRDGTSGAPMQEDPIPVSHVAWHTQNSWPQVAQSQAGSMQQLSHNQGISHEKAHPSHISMAGYNIPVSSTRPRQSTQVYVSREQQPQVASPHTHLQLDLHNNSSQDRRRTSFTAISSANATKPHKHVPPVQKVQQPPEAQSVKSAAERLALNWVEILNNYVRVRQQSMTLQEGYNREVNPNSQELLHKSRRRAEDVLTEIDENKHNIAKHIIEVSASWSYIRAITRFQPY